MLALGHDLKTQQPITLDAGHARVLLVCGKRGGGKSYTLGVLVEELFQQEPRPCVLVIDPMGSFWTLAEPADAAGGLRGAASSGGSQAAARALPVQLLVPGDPTKVYSAALRARYQQLGITLTRLTFSPSALSPDAWCLLFDVSINEPLGIVLSRAVQTLSVKSSAFGISDLERMVTNDALAHDRTKEALANRLRIASSWGLFDTRALDLDIALTPERVHVLDCSVLDYGPQGLRSLALDVLTRRLFANAQARRQAIVQEAAGPSAPKFWLVIDEAHQFLPHGAGSFCKDALIRWVKEGRQPGLSCIVASQQPGSLEPEVLSQADALIAHRLTNLDDLDAMDHLSQAYLGSPLHVYLRHLKHPGQAVLVDDARERVAMLQVRPRLTRHGGAEQ